ncbi:MAG: hypothetical protein QOG30_1081 [Acidimicrobiaceae bacterium]
MSLERRLSRITGVVVSDSMFGDGDAYWVNGKEIAHFEGDGVIEVRLTKAEMPLADRVEMLIHRSHDRRIALAVEQVQRLPEPKRGLEWGRIEVEAAR